MRIQQVCFVAAYSFSSLLLGILNLPLISSLPESVSHYSCGYPLPCYRLYAPDPVLYDRNWILLSRGFGSIAEFHLLNGILNALLLAVFLVAPFRLRPQRRIASNSHHFSEPVCSDNLDKPKNEQPQFVLRLIAQLLVLAFLCVHVTVTTLATAAEVEALRRITNAPNVSASARRIVTNCDVIRCALTQSKINGRVGHISITASGVRSLSDEINQLTSLTSLALASDHLEATTPRLAAFPQLAYLVLTNHDPTRTAVEIDLDCVVYAQRLRTLVLQGVQPSRRLLANLANHVSLDSFAVSKCTFDFAAADNIRRIPNLNRLHMLHVRFEPRALGALLTKTPVRHLWLDGSKLSNDDVLALRTASQLTELSVCDTTISSNAVLALCEKLPSLTVLRLTESTGINSLQASIEMVSPRIRLVVVKHPN